MDLPIPFGDRKLKSDRQTVGLPPSGAWGRFLRRAGARAFTRLGAGREAVPVGLTSICLTNI
jgi:hypothetical protein